MLLTDSCQQREENNDVTHISDSSQYLFHCISDKHQLSQPGWDKTDPHDSEDLSRHIATVLGKVLLVSHMNPSQANITFATLRGRFYEMLLLKILHFQLSFVAGEMQKTLMTLWVV